MSSINLEFYDRPGIVKLVSRQTGQHIPQRQSKALDHQLTGIVKTDQFPAVLDELLKVIDPGFADTAGEFRRISLCIQPIKYRVLAIGRKNDHVIVQSSRAK